MPTQIDFGGLARKKDYSLDKDSLEKNMQEASQFRQKLLEALNKRGEVSEISDLQSNSSYSTSFASRFVFSFAPVFFKVRIPTVLQTWHMGEMIDSFYVVYDGVLLLLAGENQSSKGILSFPDVRDWFISVCESIDEINSIPPNVSPASIFLDSQPEKVGRSRVYIEAFKGKPIKEQMTSFYFALNSELSLFYFTCAMRQHIFEIKTQIAIAQQIIVEDLSTLVNRSIWRFRSRRCSRIEIKNLILNLFALITEYENAIISSEDSKRDLIRDMNEKPIFKNIMEATQWEFYTKPEPLDKEYTLKIIEHAQKELEVHQVSSSTIIAAVLGGLAGFGATIVTVLLGKL